MKKEIKKYQTLLDFATQQTGSDEGMIATAVANKKSFTGSKQPGEVYSIEPIDGTVTKYFDTNGLDIVSITAGGLNGGIGYMQIGTNFIVS